MSTSTQRAIIYTRVSTNEQAENGTSLDAQEAACREFAARIGASVIAHHQDAGISGALYETRPGIQAALADIEDEKANCLIVYKVDRGGRDSEVLNRIRKRVKSAGALLLFADGSTFQENAAGNFLFNQMAAMAQLERENIKERMIAGRIRKAQDGIQTARNAAFGYRIINKKDVIRENLPDSAEGKYEIIEEQAEIIRLIFSHYAGGMSLNGLTDWLSASGYKSAKGLTIWARISVYQMLLNPVYKGTGIFGRYKTLTDVKREAKGHKAVYHKRTEEEEWITFDVPAIVDKETWDKCQERIKGNKERMSGNCKRAFPLSRILRCPVCGRGMSGLWKKSEASQTYRCNNYFRCERKGYNALRIHAAIGNILQGLAQDQEGILVDLMEVQRKQRAEFDSTAIDTLTAELNEIAAKEKIITNLQIDAAMRGNETNAYNERIDELDKRRRAIKSQVQRLEALQQEVINPEKELNEIMPLIKFACDLFACSNASAVDKYNALSQVFKTITPSSPNMAYELQPGNMFRFSISWEQCLKPL